MSQILPQALSPELREIALGALKAYLDAPPTLDGRTPVELEVEGDRKRVEVIEKTLKPLLASYLDSSTIATDFKRRIDGINKQNSLWGFGGIKGQMFFNMLFKTAEDAQECDTELKSAIREPLDEEGATSQLKNFRSYVTRIGQQFVDGGGYSYSKPKASSIPFFLSYFWQIQRREVWPVYYTNTVQMIEGMNLWEAKGDIANDYVTYKSLHEVLAQLYGTAAGRPFTLYDVEHVFWFKSGKLLAGGPVLPPTATTQDPNSNDQTSSAANSGQALQVAPIQGAALSDSYVPPVVGVIPKLGLNDLELQEAARRAGTTLDRAFEKSINSAFTILGYETQLLGQGKGRVPDGQAIAISESYAILWDAKARSDGYRMGTDDRIIRQYIETQSRSLKRGKGIRNIYYLIISSGFSDDFDDLIRTLKMDTDVNEVCLVEAAALVAIVDQKLRSPLTVSLGADGIQRLFSSSGIITASDVIDNLT